MNEILILLIAGILGVAAHCIMKAQSLKKDASVANVEWSFMDYIKEDYLGIVLSFISVAIWLIVVPEALLKYPQLEDWRRVSFVGMGMLGSYLIQTIFSVAKKRIRSKVDSDTTELSDIKGKDND